MNEKDEKIEIQLVDTKVEIDNARVEGYTSTADRKTIGEIAKLDGKSTIVKSEEVEAFFKALK